LDVTLKGLDKGKGGELLFVFYDVDIVTILLRRIVKDVLC